MAFEDEDAFQPTLPTIPDEAFESPIPLGTQRSDSRAATSNLIENPDQEPLHLTVPSMQSESLPTPPGRLEEVATPTETKFTRSVLKSDDQLDLPEDQLPITLPSDDPIESSQEAADAFATGPPKNKADTGDAAHQELLLQSARNALRLQQMDVAIKRFTEYVRTHPEDAETRLEFAGILADAGRSDAASAQIEHLMKQFPQDVSFLRRYADMQMQLSNFTKAETALVRLVEHPEYQIDAAVDLARVFAWTSRTEEALSVYEELLRDVALDNPKRQLQFAELLSDIQRPSEALQLLLQLHATAPMNLQILELIVLASARTSSRNATFDYIGRLQGIEPENVAVRYELANRLFEGGFYREAMLVDQQVLDFDPTNADSLVRSALCNLRLYDTAAAKAMLDVASQRNDVKYHRALSEYHSVVGEHADAIAICHRILFESPVDLQTRISLGHAFNRSAQLMKAAFEFGQVAALASQPGVADGPRLMITAQLAQARSLAEARRFDDAVAVLESAANSKGNKDAILDAYVDVLSKARRYSEAIQTARAGIASALGRTHRELTLRGKLGLLLARNGEYAAAIQEFKAVDAMSMDPAPEVIYGQYQAYTALGNLQAARLALDEHLGVFSSDTYIRVRIAELATEDCDCCLARNMLQQLEGLCVGNPLVSNRLGEACFQCATCEETCDCSGYFIKTLSQSPSNVRAILGLARLYSRIGNYAEAGRYYEKAICHMPDDPNLQREVGRMKREAEGPRGSTRHYERALKISSGEHLVAAAQAAPERVAELESEYHSLAEMGSIVATEMQGKWLSGWRPLSAIETYQGVSALEPRNEDALFEIGQAYSQLNRTHCAIDQYQRILCQNPCHREARVALERNYLEITPQLHTFAKYRDQAGRDELATIDSFSFGALLQIPIGEEDEFVQVGYKRAYYMPPGADQLEGDIAIGRVQWKPIWPLLLFGQLDFETYSYGFDPRLNFLVGTNYQVLENAKLRFHVKQENVFQNRVTVENDIHRIGFELGKYWQPRLPIEIDAFWRYWEYSDDNAAVEAGIHTGYKLTYGRHRLRWLTDVDYMTYREQSILDPSGNLDLTMFPYFSPRNFWYLSGGLEYRHFLRCDMFKAGNLHWFELYGGGRIDSEGVGYGLARGELSNDIHNWLTFSAYFDFVRSSVYDVSEAGVKLTIRF